MHTKPKEERRKHQQQRQPEPIRMYEENAGPDAIISRTPDRSGCRKTCSQSDEIMKKIAAISGSYSILINKL